MLELPKLVFRFPEREKERDADALASSTSASLSQAASAKKSSSIASPVSSFLPTVFQSPPSIFQSKSDRRKTQSRSAAHNSCFPSTDAGQRVFKDRPLVRQFLLDFSLVHRKREPFPAGQPVPMTAPGGGPFDVGLGGRFAFRATRQSAAKANCKPCTQSLA